MKMKTNKNKHVITLALLSCIMAAANAQTPASEAPAPDASATAKQATTKNKDTLTVDYPDEEIRVILRNVADLFDLNLVIPETLQGKTSIKLRDVNWRQIFQVVLAPVNYTFIEDGNIIKVVTQESLTLEPLSTEVFVLNYAKASDIKPSLDALVDAKVGGKIVVDGRSNSLVVSERASIVQKIRPIILSLDRATEQVMIESKFIEVTNKDVKNIGVNWASLSGYEISASGLERKYDALNGRTASNSTSESNINVDHMDQGYEKVDQLLNRNRPASDLPGLNAPGRGVGPATTDATPPATGFTVDDKFGPASNLSNLFNNNIARATQAVFSADQFKLVLSALKTLNTTKLVSNPTVVTLNNTEATINVGEEFPLPNYQYNQERGAFEVSGFTFKPIGVILKVTPQVNNAGFIKLNLEPEVSNRTNTVNFGGASGAIIPIIGVRKTKTQITLKDGYTLGLGGLMESSNTNGSSKVPLLGDIPGLGKLFRSSNKDETKRNLVIFITAKTLKPDGTGAGDVFDPRMLREMQLQKDELPGFRDGSDPFAAATTAPAAK